MTKWRNRQRMGLSPLRSQVRFLLQHRDTEELINVLPTGVGSLRVLRFGNVHRVTEFGKSG